MHWPRPAVFIAVAFLVLATLYSVTTPLFESPDELWHYPFVWHLSQTGQLPVQDPAAPELWFQEGSQPPLYYALAALLTRPIPTDDLPGLIYRNPHADLGQVTPDGNINIAVHTGRESWPWRGAVLAIHVSRLFSVLLGTGTVLTIYALGRQLWPQRRSLAGLAMAFVAFNPMFLFISASVNNDNLITLLAALVILLTVKWFLLPTSAAGAKLIWVKLIILGLLVGLAALTKVSGLGLLGLVGLALLSLGLARRDWRMALGGNALVAGLALVVAGWWYWRNLQLYGDWTGTEVMVRMMGARPVDMGVNQLWREVPGLFRSFWGVFGYFSLPLPAEFYPWLNALLAFGGLGLLVAWVRRRNDLLTSQFRLAWPILVGWLLILIVGLIQWTLRTPATQGRLLFPGLIALAPLWAAGWSALVPRPLQPLPLVGLLAVAIWVPWGLIAPAYRLPPLLADLPASAERLDTFLGEAVELVGYEAELTSLRPGDSLAVTLYWRGVRPVTADYTVFVHLLDEYDLVIAQRNVFPGLGLYPTSQWRPGDLLADTYVLRLPRTAYAPAQARFEVGLYDHQTGLRLTTPAGQDNVRFGGITVKPWPGEWPNPQTLVFDEGIILTGYQLDQRQVRAGEQVRLSLYWRAEQKPTQNYKVFVHLVGPGESRVAQSDSEPQGGAAPTGTWLPNQTLRDDHLLDVAPDAPPEAYRLVVGLYHPDTGQRLPLRQANGEPVQVDSVALAGVRIYSGP